MKKVLLVTAAALAMIASVSAYAGEEFGSPSENVQSFECSVVKVTPPDRDRDPGYKVNVSVNERGFTNVVHTTVSGATYDRADQYSSRETWNASKSGGNGPYAWIGKYVKHPEVTIEGVIGVENKTGQLSYDERIYRGKKLVTTVHTVCHAIEV